MEITAVRSYALSSPIEPVQERSFYGGTRRLLKRDVVLVLVETAAGYRGFSTAGASSSAMREYFEGDSQGTFADVLTGTISDVLVGQSIDDITDAHAAIRETDLPPRIQTEAISAIDVALYDIRGKELDRPVYELLAEECDTKPTTEMPLYASAGMYMEPSGYARQAATLEEQGFFGYKYRPGIGPEGDRETVELLVETVDEMAVMLDVHTWWKLNDAYGRETVSDLVEHASERGAYWIEEPVDPDDYDGYVALAETGAPLAGGESEPTQDGLVALAQTGAIDFLQGDVRHHSGFTGCLTAAEYCRDRPIEYVPHNFGTWFGLVANAHLVAAAPEVELVEYPVFEDDPLFDGDDDPGMYPFDLAFDILTETPDIEDGTLALSDAPGLGIDVDLDVIDEYPFIEGPWTEFHYE